MDEKTMKEIIEKNREQLGMENNREATDALVRMNSSIRCEVIDMMHNVMDHEFLIADGVLVSINMF